MGSAIGRHELFSNKSNVSMSTESFVLYPPHITHLNLLEESVGKTYLQTKLSVLTYQCSLRFMMALLKTQALLNTVRVEELFV